MKSKIIDKAKLFTKTLLFGLNSGLKSANDEMFAQVADTNNGGSEINHKITVNSMFGDFINGEETERVQETRDKYYRILNEADKYKVNLEFIGGNEGDEGSFDTIVAKTSKKKPSDYARHCNVMVDENEKIIVIQDNKTYEKTSIFAADLKDFLNTSMYDYYTTLTIERDDFVPKFLIEKFVNKIVVKECEKEGKHRVDLYATIYASQFGKIDALLIAELRRIMDSNNLKSEMFDFTGMSFITDKAFNSEDLCQYKYNNIKFLGIDIYDGNFVIKFICDILSNGNKITDKYRMKSVDTKYANNELKSDTPNVFDLVKSEKNKELKFMDKNEKDCN